MVENSKTDINLKNKLGDTPLDTIIHRIQYVIKHVQDYYENYKYVKLWNILVANGAMLAQRKVEYQNLNPHHFKKPQSIYLQLIKQNPPKNCGNTKFRDNEEEIKENE